MPDSQEIGGNVSIGHIGTVLNSRSAAKSEAARFDKGFFEGTADGRFLDTHAGHYFQDSGEHVVLKVP
jgi:hypothetical protein